LPPSCRVIRIAARQFPNGVRVIGQEHDRHDLEGPRPTHLPEGFPQRAAAHVRREEPLPTIRERKRGQNGKGDITDYRLSRLPKSVMSPFLRSGSCRVAPAGRARAHPVFLLPTNRDPIDTASRRLLEIGPAHRAKWPALGWEPRNERNARKRGGRYKDFGGGAE
jgi:hypothetical protein